MTPVTRIDWGPLPQLAQRLAGSRHPRFWTDGIRRPGRLWMATSADRLQSVWPTALRLVPVPPRASIRVGGSWYARLWPLVVGTLGAWADRLWRPPRAAPPGPTMSPEQLLRAAHIWAGSRTLSRLAPLFEPFGDDLPTPIAQISNQGVIRLLAAYHVDTWGPVSRPALPAGLDGANGMTAGDCVAFHFAIEDVMRRVGERLQLVRTAPLRRPGGLRTETFLRVWPALLMAPRRTDAAGWREPLEELIARSPLTQVVYPDLVACARPDPATFAPVFSALRSCSAPEADASTQKEAQAAFVGGTSPLAPAHSGWAEVFASLLARSLLGGLLSPAGPAPEAERALEEARAHARERYGLVGDRARRVNDDPKVIAAMEAKRDSVALEGRIYAGRLVFLCAALTDAYVKVRWIDMLVRQIAVECAAEIVARFAKAPQDKREPRERFFFRHADAVCFTMFERMVFGPSGMLFAESDAAVVATLREHLSHSMLATDPCSSWERTESRAGLPGSAVRALTAVYGDVGDTGTPVAVPVSRVGHVPRKIWREWILTLLARLPSPAAQTETTAEQIAGDAA